MNESQKITVYAGAHKIKLLVNASYKVSDLIFILERETGIPQQELKLNDLKYGDSRELYTLCNGSIVFIQGVLDLCLRLPAGETHTIFVLDSWKVDRLYPIIERKTGIKMNGKILEIGGKQVYIRSTFREQSVQMDSAILIKDMQ